MFLAGGKNLLGKFGEEKPLPVTPAPGTGHRHGVKHISNRAQSLRTPSHLPIKSQSKDLRTFCFNELHSSSSSDHHGRRQTAGGTGR